MPSVPAISELKPWDRPEWFQDRHYAFGICRACGFKAAYPINDLDNFDGPYFRCISCGSGGRMTPGKPDNEEEAHLLEKANRLVGWVPSIIVKEEVDVRQGRRFRFDEDSGKMIADRREYGFEAPKEARPEGRVRRDRATGKLVPFPKRAP